MTRNVNYILFAICFAAVAQAQQTPQTAPKDINRVSPQLLPKNNNLPYVGLDYLYWVAKQEGNNYAATGTAITVPGTVDPNTAVVPPALTGTGSVYAPDAKAKSGFKATLGMNLERDSWDLFATYTYLTGHDTSSVASTDLNTGISPLYAYTSNNGILASTTIYAATGATGFVTEASSNWYFQFNNINLELSKSIPLFSALVLKPHFGLQGSWQKQNFQATYQVSSIADGTAVLGNNEVGFHQNFWGVGPRAGLESVWQLCNHLGIYADSALALLWGSFKAQSTSYDTNTTAGYANTLISNQTYRPTTLSPMIEVGLGFASDWMFKDRYRLVASLGWDAQVWFAQNQHSTSISDTNLLFQGLDASLRMDF